MSTLEEIGLSDLSTKEDVQAWFRSAARAAHPDMGGSAEAFQTLIDQRDKALQELQMGETLANARLRLSALREAARGVPCPRCYGTGIGMSKAVPGSFKPFQTKCRLCGGKGKLS